MSWDLDAMSCLPPKVQDDVAENFTPEYLADALTTYIAELEARIVELEAVMESVMRADYDYFGGHRGDDLEVYHHGIHTCQWIVSRALKETE